MDIGYKIIAIIDSSDCTLSIYEIPSDEVGNEEIEAWILDYTSHKLSEISWGEFDGNIDDQRN